MASRSIGRTLRDDLLDGSPQGKAYLHEYSAGETGVIEKIYKFSTLSERPGYGWVEVLGTTHSTTGKALGNFALPLVECLDDIRSPDHIQNRTQNR